MGILRDVIGISANNENRDYRSLREKTFIVTGASDEISALYRKDRALITADDSLHGLRNCTDKIILRGRRRHGR